MLFLWSKEPTPKPRADPWFAWIVTALLIWRCRRRLTKTILSVSPFRLFRRRQTNHPSLTKGKASLPLPVTKERPGQLGQLIAVRRRQLQLRQLRQRKRKTGVETRIKRLCTGDGPHLANQPSRSRPCSQVASGYRVTRSGKIYGRTDRDSWLLRHCTGEGSRLHPVKRPRVGRQRDVNIRGSPRACNST